MGFLGHDPDLFAGLIPIGASRSCHVEFDFVRQFDDGLGMVMVLEQRVFDSLRAVDEQAAIEPALFLDDPVAARPFLPMKTMVDADLHDGGSTSFTSISF